MRRQHCYQWEVLSKNCQQQWMSLLLGIVLTLVVVGVWQEVLQEELQAGVQFSLPNVVLFGGVIGAWALALAVYLGQRSERYARQARKINQQLQQEILERQNIETELRSRETSIRNLTARLELAVESAQIGIWDWDVIADRLIWNDQMHKLYGLKPSDFSGVYEAWATALHPEDFELTTTAIQQAIRGEREYEPEFRVVHPDGTIRFIQAHAVVQRDAQGQAQRMIGVNFDITERKQSERVLKESISQLKQTEAALEKELLQSRTLLNTSIDGIVVLNHQGNVAQTSSRFAEMLGYTVEETLQLNLVDWDAQWTKEELQHILQQSLELPPVFETRHRRKDGSVYDVEISYDRVKLDGEVMHFCICRDISERKRNEAERKQAEIELQNSRARFAGILEIANDAIISVNANQQITLFNKGAEKIFGYQAEEILGQPLAKLMPERFAQAHHHHVNHYAHSRNHTRQMAQRGAIFGRRKDGTEFPAEASISKLSIDGEITFTTFLRDITARQQAESAIAHLAAIVESSEDAIIGKSLEGIITSWNAGAEKLFGYTADEVIGQPITILMPDCSLDEETYILERIQQGKRIPPYDTTRRGKDGTLIDVSITVSPIKDANGTIIGASKIARDIRERKHVEAVLRQSEEKFRMAIDFTYNWEYWQAPDGLLVYVSPSCERITGYTPAEFSENPHLIQAIVHPDDASIIAHHVCDSQFETGSVEFRIITCSQEVRWIAHVCQPVFSSTGEYLGKRASNRDITERIQLEAERQQSNEALRQSEARFQAFMYYSPAPAWISDSEGQISYLSQAYLDTFQVPNEDFVGQSIFDLFPVEVAQPLLKNIQTVARTQQVLEAIEIAPRRDGTRGTFLVYKFPMPNSSGQPLIGGVAIDITQQQQTELALRQSEATKQAIIQAIPDLLMRMRSDGGYIEFISNGHFNIINPALVRQDATAYDVLPTHLAQLRMHHTRLALECNTVQVYEHEIAIEGQQRYEEVRIAPLLQDEVLVMVRDITDREQSAAALQLSQERLQLALEASGDGLWDWDMVTGEVYYSPQYMTMLGYGESELPQNFETWKYLTHPDDQPWALDRLNSHIQDSSQQYAFDYRLRAKSGGWKWVADYGKVVARDEQGKPLRMIGTHRDISDRKQAEIALQESAAREQAIAEVLQQMRQSLSLETIFATTTQELRRVLNCDRVLVYRFNPDWSGAVVAESVGSGWISVIETLIHQDVSFGAHTSEQDRCIIKRWESREAETKDTYIHETQGSAYSQGTRYLAVNDIHQSGFEDCYVEFLEKFQARAYLTVPIFSNNKLWGLLASYQNSEPRAWRDSEVQVASQIVAQLGIAVHQAELFAQIQRQSKELRQAMEAAEAANLAKSMFLANMSHELRTPLNVILGFAQIMSHDASLTPNQRDDLQTIQRSSDHLLSLINDVLDLSKIEAGHYTLEESGFDLISLLHTLRTMMVERAKTKQLQLTFEIAPDVPQFVIADEQKLRQVLLNLLSNAVKFTKQGSVTLRVTSWESSEKTCLVPNASPHGNSLKHSISSAACTLQFEVADTGVGIAPTEHEAIFDAFTQAEAGRKAMGGTGLGLTISRKLLELMDGSISVESHLGNGSTFTVRVPVCPTSGVDGQVEQQEKTILGLVAGQPHRRILVVDDQPENRSLMVRLLTRLGLEVQEATDGQEAIALWQHWKPDLTWMDIRMPVLDGYEATKQIRAMEHEQASIIIALTAQASQSDRALALAAGCNDYLSKPFREETLFLKLKEYLGLEYLYAEASDLSNSPSALPLDANTDHLNAIDPLILAQVPTEWLETLEDLALCGNDRAIVDLVNQLAPEFAPFRMQLLDLVNRFEFEQIVHLIHCGSSP